MIKVVKLITGEELIADASKTYVSWSNSTDFRYKWTCEPMDCSNKSESNITL